MAKIDFGGTLATNKSALKGVVSGLDTEAIIEGLVEKRQAPIKIQQDQIKIDNEKIQAFGEMRTKVNTLQAATAKLKGLNYMESGENALQYKTTSISTNSGESPDLFLKVSADYDAQLGDFSIKVNQLATSHILQSSSFSSSTGNATTTGSGQVGSTSFNTGTFQINGASITVHAGDSISAIANTINNFTSTTNVAAQVVMIANGTYELVLQSTLTGTANAITITDTGNVINGVINTASPLQQAQDAKFTFNGGMTVTRSSNSVNDFISGVTLDLISPSTSAMTVQIKQDFSHAADAVQSFVEAYNDFAKFAAQQQARSSDGTYLDCAKIRNNLMMETLASNIQTNALKLALPEESALNIGIYKMDKIAANPSTDEPEYLNLLSFDPAAFVDAINSNPQYVTNLLQFSAPSTNTMKMFHSPTKLDSGTLNFDIDTTRTATDIVRVSYGGTQYNMTFKPNVASDLTKGGLLVGLDGTPLENMVIGYTGTGIETSSITFNQGVVNSIYGFLEEINKVSLKTGMDDIQEEISYILQDRTNKEQDVSNKLNDLTTYKQSLVTKYSKLEAAIAKANMVLTMIEIQVSLMNQK